MFFVLYSGAQNFVPNGSFESYTVCPTAAQFYNLPPWCGLGGGEDSYNTCFNVFGPGGNGVPETTAGFQYPRTGNGFGSVLLKVIGTGTVNAERREYLHTPLVSVLQNGKTYCGTFYVNVNNDAKYTTDRIGMALTSNSYICNQAMPTPQTIAPLGLISQVENIAGNFITDTLNWVEISGTFTATGTEAYLTIGNFYNDANTNQITLSATRTVCYLFIDDVSIEEVFPVKTKSNATIMQGDSVVVGDNTSEAAVYNWQPSAGLSCINCANPKASPTITTTYTVTKTQCKAVTSDEITVSVSPTGINELSYANSIKISPNPAQEYLSIDIPAPLPVMEKIKIKITDVLGRDILMTDYQSLLNISTLEKGIYFISVLQGSRPLVTKKIIKE